jgi:CelD/BcsL family acetyltransferase involved in cellulose biosynthesis
LIDGNRTGSTLSLETISDFSALLEREPEWSRFAASLPGVTPFQLPVWLLTWWRHFGSGELCVFIFRSRNEIVAVVPCFRHEWSGKRQMTLIGSGISDYLEPGIACERTSAVLQKLADHLRDDSGWEICVWQDLNAATPLRALPVDQALAVTVEPEIECTETQISENFERWWEQRPHGLRRNVRRYLEKARSIAEPEFSVCSKADPEIVNALISLHGARWRRHGEPGMIRANKSGQFLPEIFDQFACADMLRLFALRFQEKIVAVICSFPYRRRLFSYLSAFDPEYEMYGFGRLLLYYSMRYAFEERYLAWNFLRGSEAYKFEWGARSIPKCRLIVTRDA